MTADTPPQQKEEANGRSGPCSTSVHPPVRLVLWQGERNAKPMTLPLAPSQVPWSFISHTPGPHGPRCQIANSFDPRQRWHDDLTSALFGM